MRRHGVPRGQRGESRSAYMSPNLSRRSMVTAHASLARFKQVMAAKFQPKYVVFRQLFFGVHALIFEIIEVQSIRALIHRKQSGCARFWRDEYFCNRNCNLCGSRIYRLFLSIGCSSRRALRLLPSSKNKKKAGQSLWL